MAFVAFAEACTLNVGGREAAVMGADAAPDTSVAVDVGVDEGTDAAPDVVAIADAGTEACSPTSFRCGGQCVDTCMGCAAGESICQTTRACGHCNDCPGFDIECFTCPPGGSQASFCGQPGANPCGQAPRCACADGDAGDCPGTSQACSVGQCLSCGEPGTDKLACSGGMFCVAGEDPPACDGNGG